MTLNIRLEITGVDLITSQLAKIYWTLTKMAKTQQELVTDMEAQSAQIEKIGGETQSLIDLVKDLLEQIQKGPVSPELEAASLKVTNQLQVVDDLVKDTVPEGGEGGEAAPKA
jgi:wobble nucleotide-excising tRNase